MSDTGKHIAGLSPERRKLLERLAQQQGINLSRSVIVPHPPTDTRFPASYAQKRLWFLDQLDPQNIIYNVPLAVRLVGKLDVPALEKSISIIIRRHEILRTRFTSDQGQPYQIVDLDLEFHLAPEDLSQLPAAELRSEVTRRVQEEVCAPFDLATGPLFRARLLVLSDQEAVLVISMHHIITDGWSMSVLINELGAIYPAVLTGTRPDLPELPIQYADYGCWQLNQLESSYRDQMLDYWTNRLAGCPAILELPTDRPRPPAQTYNGGAVEFEIPVETARAVRALAQKETATQFMLLLAAFQAFLYRMTGQEDFVVGSPVANRNRPEVQSLIGFFVNTILLRSEFTPELTFRELVRVTRVTTLEAQDHQDLPFEMIVDALHPERNPAYNPLFQVLFVLQNQEGHGLELPGLRLVQETATTGASKFDLTLVLQEEGDRLTGMLEYNADLFEAETMRRWTGHFTRLLESAARAPDQAVSALPILSGEEREKILYTWNSNKIPFPEACGTQEIVEEQVRRTPGSVAIEFEDRRMTYDELDRRANRLGRYLRRCGVVPEQIVGVSLEHSPEYIVAILAVLKAGGAYMPLDPAYPAERLHYMLRDSSARVLITDSALLPNLRMDGVQAFCMDTDWPLLAGEDDSPLTPVSNARNLAYIIYTSGSTGQPKGTLLEHYGLNSLIYEYARLAGITAASRVMQYNSIGFDASIMAIFTTLSMGGTLIMTTREVRQSAELLHRFLRERRISCVLMPPVMIGILPNRDLPDLKCLVSGGDVCPWELVDRWSTPGRDFVNGYGPTEITVGSSFWTAVPDYPRTTHMPIGRPLANVTYYILDRHMQPVPVGVLGELHIGGVGVARGYLNRPDLTAERFIPDPFMPGQRLYRTGDLARFLPDGNVEFFGRVDFQVKLRGFRIELGEIEAALRAFPGVEDAVVLVREDTPGDKRLAAYLIPADRENSPAAADLRAFLHDRLPEYMIPAAFVTLESFPVTPAGKLNRKALPAPVYARSADTPMVPPRTPQEEILAGIWTQVLGSDHIGVYDNFFEIGGHSLLATQLTSRIREAFGVEIPLRTLFEVPTIAGLAQKLAEQDVQMESRRIPVVPTLRTEDSPLSFTQQRLWFVNEFEPGSAVYNVPLAVRLSGQLSLPDLEASLSEIIRRHEVLRSNYATVDGKPRLLITPDYQLSLPVTSLEHLPGAEVEAEVIRIANGEARRPFNLARDRLMRANLLRLNEQEHVLIIVMHHIVTDGWSLNILVRELASIYTAFTAGKPSPLPELSIQYPDYAAWQQRWFESEIYQQELAYWKQQLADAPSSLDLPTDRPRPAVSTNTGGTYSFRLPAELSAKLKDLSTHEGVTLFMTLLAAFQILMARYSGQDDICVGTPIADRMQAEVENLIGFFANTLVMRSKVPAGGSFRDFLKQVRETALGAYAHQDMPFEKLVDALQPERDTSHSPIFQVMFILQNGPFQSFPLPDLVLSEVDIQTEQSMFELTLVMEETHEGLAGGLEYNADLFNPETMERLALHLQTLLEAIAADPDAEVSQLPILPAREKRRVVYEWNQTAVEFPLQRCVHQLFEEQVERTPGALAVRFQNQSLTYAQLNARANQLAHALIVRGAGPEKLVGICVERSLEMIVGLLGILKSGAAYLPLDPVYPPERLEYMLQDSGAEIVLMQQQVQASFSTDAVKIFVDADWPEIARLSEENPAVEMVSHNPAYMIYTSGSTGQPKGVVVPHRCVVNHNCGIVRAFGITPADRMLQFATISFDTAIEEIFPTLISGAVLVLRPEQQLSSIPQFMTLIAEEQLTILDLPTAYWHEWVNQLVASPQPLPPSLRLVVVGGEKALPERYQDWYRLYGSQVGWLNTYGPTEGTIIATLFRPPAGGLDPDNRLPIGRPVDNDRIYILDAHRQPVPVGVPGELYIAGEGVARGYHNRPDLTAERFLPDPFVPGSRMYRTGDLARFLPDGNIEYTGRVDHQVKIRGFRVEMGEIETLLRAHPRIADAVVLAREDTPGIRRLVAYIVPRAQPAPSASELRSYLKEQLPEYMLPALFVSLDTLPLTPGGKVNRAVLPAPEQDRPELDSDYTAPQTENEKILAAIWCEVLGIQKVGIHDNFFELGGDSILSIQVISRANQAGLHLQPRHLFEAQTIYQLAGLVGEEPENAAQQGLVSGPVPFTPIQHWFFEQQFARPHHWNQALLFESALPLDRAALEQTLAALSIQHDMLRARFTPTSAGWQQTILDTPQPIPLEWIDLADVPDGELSARIENECARVQASLNLTTGPIAGAAYFDAGPARQGRMLLVIHHLVVDGISWRVLLEDFQTVYRQTVLGQAPELPAKTTSFQQWAAGLEEYAASDAAAGEMEYWLASAQGQTWPLPVDFPGGENTESSVESVTCGLTPEETQALLTEVPAAFHTEINDVLLAALITAFWRWTGRQTLLVDLEGHGREDILPGADLTRTVGWFTTIFPVRLDITALATPEEILMRVKEQLHRVPKHGIGFGLLRYLSPDVEKAARLAALARPEVSFNYLGQVPAGSVIDPIIRPAREDVGPSHAPVERRNNLVDVTAVSGESGLNVTWTYSRNLHRAGSIQALAGYYREALQQLIAACKQPGSAGPTPSDFPMARLNQKKLDGILNRLNQSKGNSTR